MTEKLVITISREFGSGGRLIGEKLAKDLGFAFYDKSLIYLAVAKSGLDPVTIENAEEGASSKLLFHLAIGGYVSSGIFSQVNAPISDQVFFAQSKVVEEIAEHGDCVIIGRCANHILRERPNCAHVFIYGSDKDRLRRVVEDYGVKPEEAGPLMAKIDKGRANYHEYYTEETWGSHKNYDLSINTSSTGVNRAVSIIRALVDR